jgi:uncharacterized membrane protein
MHWIVFALISAISYFIHDFILKLSADKLNPYFTGFLLSLSSTIACGLFWLFQNNNQHTNFQAMKDIKWVLFAGIFLAIASIAFIKTFSGNAPFNIAMPLIYIAIILLGVLSGTFIFKENLNYTQIAGIVLCCAGLLLVFKK